MKASMPKNARKWDLPFQNLANFSKARAYLRSPIQLWRTRQVSSAVSFGVRRILMTTPFKNWGLPRYRHCSFHDFEREGFFLVVDFFRFGLTAELSSNSISLIVGRLFFRFFGKEETILFWYLAIPMGLLISLRAYSAMKSSFSLHIKIPIVGLSVLCLIRSSTAGTCSPIGLNA